ncbi:MAG: GH25 family lysozyme, partial [Berryella intestinalis]|uniref:GH25 family lysozyme n=1 Tax=Berryella intestinalis TaxID=1531429 RepID=UPI002A75AFCC
MAVKVIDVSYAQGRMDWEAVAPHIGGAIIQMGYGSDYASQDDAQWARNVAECRRLGIPFGAYLYSYAKTDDQARSEVAHALRLLPPASELALPVYLDVEESGNAWYFRRAIEIWVSGLRAAGYTAGWYSGRALANQQELYDAPGASWVAEYGSSRCGFLGRLDAWQYTSQEYVNGVGPLDASWFYGTHSMTGDADMRLMDQEVVTRGGSNVNAGQALGWGYAY